MNTVTILLACVVAIGMYKLGLSDGHEDGCRITQEVRK